MNYHIPKQVTFSLFWTWVVVLARYLSLVIFFGRNNEGVVLGFCPQRSNSKIHKTLSTNAIKIKISNLQVKAFNI